MADDEPAFIPRIVRRVRDALIDGTGATPTITQVADRVLRLTMSSDRVHMTLDFKPNGRGGYRWAGSTLAIDGEQVPIAKSGQHFIDIWHDPSLGKPIPPPPPGEATLPPPPPAADPSEAPRAVRDYYERVSNGVRARGEDPDGFVILGRAGGSWIVHVAADERTGMRISIGKTRDGRWGILQDGVDHIMVIRDGCDHSAQANGDVGRALRLMLGGQPGSGPAEPSSFAPGTRQPSAGTTGVQVRKTTVMRV